LQLWHIGAEFAEPAKITKTTRAAWSTCAEAALTTSAPFAASTRASMFTVAPVRPVFVTMPVMLVLGFFSLLGGFARFEYFAPSIGDGIDALVIDCRAGQVALIFEQLQGRVNHSWAWPVEPGRTFFERLDQFIAVMRGVFEQFKQDKLDIAAPLPFATTTWLVATEWPTAAEWPTATERAAAAKWATTEWPATPTSRLHKQVLQEPWMWMAKMVEVAVLFVFIVLIVVWVIHGYRYTLS
jgi:hypothetical protein